MTNSGRQAAYIDNDNHYWLVDLMITATGSFFGIAAVILCVTRIGVML